MLTVVIADVVGSTALQESLDAESAQQVMKRFYEAMRAVLEAHGGTLAKFIGDAVVAAFGVPSVHEDDALRAVRAAAAMVVALGELNLELDRRWGVRLQLRIGVNTGELVVSEEGVLVGDTMNTTARLEQAAPAGGVLVGEATWRLVHHAVELDEVAPLELRGKAGRVRAWRLVSAPVADRRRTSGVEAPLVGRGDELERLREAFDGVVSSRECRLVTVMGSPGVGKTRLAREFGAAVSGLASVVEGRCEPTGEGITFLPVAEVLRVVAGIGEADPSDMVRTKLLALTPEDDPDRGRQVDAVAGVLGVAEPASAQETFWALRRGLEFLARERPLVLVLDDLHWGQPMLLDLVEHLVEWVRDAPTLIVALARPELRDARGALASAGRGPTAVIELEPLDESDSRRLVSGLLGEVHVPEALSSRILGTTEGNPLFLGETVRMLVDEGILRREGDAWVAASELDEVEVPPTIQALLAARIERLRSDERSVVERAAVIGKQFYRGAVAELVAAPVRTEIDRHLEALRRKDMVEPEGTYWIDEPVYRFHHALIRDAAYRSLLKEARAELHERFADWLELKAGELVGEHEDVIAFHLEQAHEYRRQLGPLDERGRALGARAAERLHSAGRRALAREDLAAATNLLSRALLRESGFESEILWDLCEAVLSAGDTATAAGLVEQLGDGAGDDVMRDARARVLKSQLANLTGAGHVAQTAEVAAAAAAELGRLGDQIGEAKGWHVVAGAYVRLGQVAAVEDALDRALAAARAVGDRRRTTIVLAGAPRAALWGPSPVVRASGRCLDVVRILRMTPGNRHVEAIALRCQAVLEAMRGRYEAAREILEAGRTTLEELGLTLELHETAVHAGIVELLASDAGSAADHLRGAREGFEALGVAAGAAQAAALLARALVEQGGQDDETLEQTMFAEEHAGEDLKTTITWCSARAEALARTGDFQHARELAERAVALAEPTDALADKADASMALARVLLAAGEEGAARAAAGSAAEWYEAKGHTVGGERATELVGELAEPKRGEAPDTVATGLGERPPEHIWAEWARRYAARDVDGMLELMSEEYAFVDHRSVGWDDSRGLEGVEAVLRSVFTSSDDVRIEIEEVLACDDRVIAMRIAYRGHGRRAGEFESAFGYISVVEGGRLAAIEQYDYDDDAAMIARYAELGGGLGPLGDRPPERWWARLGRLVTLRDREALGELYTEDGYQMVDHRPVGWEPGRGRQSVVDRMGTIWAGSSVVRLEIDEVLACDDRVIALRITWQGTATETNGGGQFTFPLGVVVVVEDARAIRVEQYEPEDGSAMLARFTELGGRAPVTLGDRPPERFWAEFKRRFDAHDADGLVALMDERRVLNDHRKLGWEAADGPHETREGLMASFDASPDIRVDLDEVLACDNRVIALRIAYRGHAFDGSGEFESPIGSVTVIEDGRLMRADRYEPEDRHAMIARYVELGGGLGPLGERPPERFSAEWGRRFARRKLDRLLELHAEGVVEVDHRQLSWDEVRGRDRFAVLLRSGFDAFLDLRLEIDEVLACDDRVIALRQTFRGHALEGGGEFAVPVGVVNVIEDGLLISVDQYEPDEREAMLARFAKLGGRRSTAVGDRPPERWCAEIIRRHRARDVDAVIELHAEDIVMTDHRVVGWDELRGREALRGFYESIFKVAPSIGGEVDEVLACDDRVIATRMAYRGEGKLAGEFADLAGYVAVVEDGRAARIDVYDYDDSFAMLRRYHELGGYPIALGRRPPERQTAIVTQRLAARDLDALMEIYSEDVSVRDHRALPWEEARGREDLKQMFESGFGTLPDFWIDIDEVLACDDRVLAHRYTFRAHALDGGGETALPVGSVNVLEGGQWTSIELFEPADREGMLARFAELSGGDRARAERLVRDAAATYNTHGLQALVAWYREGASFIDRRELGWEPMHGLAEIEGFYRSAFTISSDIHQVIDEVLAADERVVAVSTTMSGTGADGGGEFEYRFGYVTVFEAGLIASHDVYGHDDREAMLARYEELSSRTEGRIAPDVLVRDRRGFPASDTRGVEAYHALIGAGDSTVLTEDGELRLERIEGDAPLLLVSVLRNGLLVEAVVLLEEERAREWLTGLKLARRYEDAGADLEELMACFHSEGRWIDHRPLQLHTATDAAAIREFFVESGKLLRDPRVTVEVLEAYPGAQVWVTTWSGIDRSAGGPVEWRTFQSCRSRDGLVEENHTYSDLEPALEKLGDLSPQAAHARILSRYVETVNARDWAAVAKLCAEDCAFVEHRQVEWHDAEGVAGLIAVWEQTVLPTSDHAVRVEIVDDDGSEVLATRHLSSSTSRGGPSEAAIDCILGLGDGLVARTELFASDQGEALRARLAELRAGTATESTELEEERPIHTEPTP